MNKSVKKLLRDKNYVSFFFATAFSMGSSNILQFTLALYILNKTGSPLVYASILSIIIIPRLLLTPIAGVMGDRFKRIHILKVLNVLQLLMMLGYLVYASVDQDISLVSVYVLVVLLETMEVFYGAAESSILSEIVEKELMEEAVTLSKVDDGIVYVTMPIIAAFIYHNFGIRGSFLIISCFLGIALLLKFLINTPYATRPPKDKVGGFKSYVEEFKEGLTELNKIKFAKIFVIVAPLINFSFSAVFSVVITYLFLEVFKIDGYMYGIYRTAIAIVSIILPLLILPIVKKVKPERLLRYSALSISGFLFLIASCAYFGMNGGENAVFIAVCMITVLDCLIISSVMPLNIATQVFFQKNIPNEYRSRIMSIFSMLALSSIPLGNMFYGFLSDIFPAYIGIFISGIAVLATYPLILHVTKNSEKEVTDAA